MSRSVVAPSVLRGEEERCAVLDFLSEQPSNMQGSAKGFVALFRRYAECGRGGLTSEQFHLANQEEKIWEFRKGALRIYCFEDRDGALVVLTNGVVKKTQKTKMSDVEAALAVKKQYVSAKAAGGIELTEISKR